MIKDRKFTETIRGTHMGEPGWMIRFAYTNDLGERQEAGHWIPDVAFAARAVEYGIDPQDVDTILDVLLTEIFIPQDEVDHATTIYGAASDEATRKAHLSRCARVKLRHRWSTRPNKSVLRTKAANPGDPTTAEEAEAAHPLDAIREHYRSSPDGHEDLMEHCRRNVERNRERLAGRTPE